jgi:anaerobic ribonucleoside-triphosphate reductase activating protein
MFFTYSLDFNPAFQDKISWASDQIEIHILKDGSLIITGFRGQVLSE